MIKSLSTLGVALLCASTSFAQLVLTNPGTAVTEDFSGFDGSGFSPTPGAGQLDSDTWSIEGLSDGSLAFGATETSGDFARGLSNGHVTTGGIYAFEVGTNNPALGFQPTGTDFNPGTITLRAVNQTGSTLDAIDLAFSFFTYNDQGRSSLWSLSYSWDNVTYTPVAGTSLISPTTADASPTWVGADVSATLNTPWADSAFIYFRGISQDEDGSGSRDEFALDDISITGRIISTALTPVPEPRTYGMIGGILLLGAIALRRTQTSSPRTAADTVA